MGECWMGFCISYRFLCLNCMAWVGEIEELRLVQRAERAFM
jgi:hypothetical protein